MSVIENDIYEHKQANINVESRRFGVIITLLLLLNRHYYYHYTILKAK